MNLLKIFQGSQSARFYDWFEQAAQNNVAAAQELEHLCLHFADAAMVAAHIHELEHLGDDISHNIYDELNRVFVTPLDREDIISLTRALDDVMDLIHASVDAMAVYNVSAATPIAGRMAGIIRESTKMVAEAMPNLRNRRTFRNVSTAVIEINRLENEADEQLRIGLSELFKTPHDPVDIIRWRDIYETMESVTDAAEDIADVLRGLVTKYA
jgi:predicted phosphate transport protein (TIGR00153 family)